MLLFEPLEVIEESYDVTTNLAFKHTCTINLYDVRAYHDFRDKDNILPEFARTAVTTNFGHTILIRMPYRDFQALHTRFINKTNRFSILSRFSEENN